MISRRAFLGAAAAASLLRRDGPPSSAPGRVVGADGARVPDVELVREWNGAICRSRIVNRGRASARIKEVILGEFPLGLPPNTSLYGEGFQMLSQTAGTIAQPFDLSAYTDAKHYRIPTGGERAYYGLLALSPPAGQTRIFAFTSCSRFSGRFEFDGAALLAIVDCEGLVLDPGRSWPLEELMVAGGADRTALFAGVAARLSANHPAAKSAMPPTGWCSWYCFGPKVTAREVLDNLDAIARTFPSLKYIQIDDGYQPAMGDWLESGAAFGGSVRAVLAEITRRGFEPAIWVAPFIAEEKSHLFQAHPDWFVKDEAGAPLRSDRVTFGGWRHAPWYVVDGTHPTAQAHLERVFRTMREEWGCTYFKLDATFWGAMHGSRFHDPRATRVEAYRRGMQAVRRGAGDAFLLGCNHPMWPSVGMIDGSRSSNDIKRTWDRIASTARQNLSRNWQNGRLWWNDPDAVVLTGDVTDLECQFHATAIYASGGMVLSGDDLTGIPPARAAMLEKLLPPTGIAASFADPDLRVGIIDLPDARMVCLFNWADHPDPVAFDLERTSHVTDFWSGESLGRHEGRMSVDLPPHSARLLKVTA